jgi:hypothetical protein
MSLSYLEVALVWWRRIYWTTIEELSLTVLSCVPLTDLLRTMYHLLTFCEPFTALCTIYWSLYHLLISVPSTDLLWTIYWSLFRLVIFSVLFTDWCTVQSSAVYYLLILHRLLISSVMFNEPLVPFTDLLCTVYWQCWHACCSARLVRWMSWQGTAVRGSSVTLGPTFCCTVSHSSYTTRMTNCC